MKHTDSAALRQRQGDADVAGALCGVSAAWGHPPKRT